MKRKEWAQSFQICGIKPFGFFIIDACSQRPRSLEKYDVMIDDRLWEKCSVGIYGGAFSDHE